jgi:hypothetical protein
MGAGKAISVLVMPRKVKTSEKSDAALNGHVAKPAAKKARAPRKKAESGKAPIPKKATPHISDEAIRTRAYFIAEQRERMAIPGDANSDWIEARRQLLAELGGGSQEKH